MLRYICWSLLFITKSFLLIAQEKTVKGRIIDAETKKPIPYVNIGISQKNTGTVSDEQGQFELKVFYDNHINDSITFSHIGYQSTKRLVRDLLNQKTDIPLEIDSDLLPEIMIRPRKFKNSILGRKGRGLGLMHYNFYTYHEKDVDDRLSKEAGILLKIKNDCFLNELRFTISSNEFSSLKFRLNFYKIVNGLPQEIILPKEIIFEIKNEYTGLYTLDLRSYNLLVTKDMGEIAATIQWVESKKSKKSSKYFSLYSSMSTTESFFSRDKAMGNWERSKQEISFFFISACY